VNIYSPVSSFAKESRLSISIGLAGETYTPVYIPYVHNAAIKLNLCVQQSTERQVIIAFEGAVITRRILEVMMGMTKSRYRFIYFLNNRVLCLDRFYLQTVGLFDTDFKLFEMSCYDMAIRFHEKDYAVYEAVLPRPQHLNHYSMSATDVHKFKAKWKSYRNGMRRLRPEKEPVYHTDDFNTRIEPHVYNSEISVFQEGDYPFINLGNLNNDMQESNLRKDIAANRLEGFKLHELPFVENTRERSSSKTPKQSNRNELEVYTR